MSKLQDSINLVKHAQEDTVGMERLLDIIRVKHMPKRIKNYCKRNVLVEQADIESEFMMTCWRAIPQASLEIGDPLMFVLWKAELAVQQLFRKGIPKGVSVRCPKCKTITRLLRKGGKSLCATCESSNVTTFMTEVGHSQLTDEERSSGRTPYDRASKPDPFSEIDGLFDLNTLNINIEAIQSRLRGRVRELFDILVIEELNRFSSDNYLAEIANRWGVTTACVSVYLKKLRVAIINYYDEQVPL